MALSGFFFLMLSVIGSWVYRKQALLLCLMTIGTALCFITIQTSFWAVAALLVLVTLWCFYKKRQMRLISFICILAFSTLFKWHAIPGMPRLFFTENFALSLDSTLVGLIPLCFFVPLGGKNVWKVTCTQGLLFSLTGIALMILPALFFKIVRFAPALPSYPALRYANQLFFVVTTEEAFYRGFMQKELPTFLCQLTKKQAQFVSYFVTTLFFTLVHWFWVSQALMLVFVFLAGGLYGLVYLKTGRLESAMLCHFLLNGIHMTFFSYHAM